MEEFAMEILDAIKKRKSIRGFKSDLVPKSVIREILELAGMAPSAMNTQPWEFAVLAGEPLGKIREGNAEKFRAGEATHPEHHVVGWKNDSIYRERQIGLAKHTFQIMEIPREDKVKRMAWMERGIRYFDAPAAIALDVGAAMQNICLAALSFGLGTCIHDQGVLYPEVVKRIAGIPDSKRLIIAISIGYPEEGNIVNTITTTRESIDDCISWVGFP